jgi:hypothetical protein
MHLIVLPGIILLMLGLITLNSQVSIAKHEESNSDDKKSDSNNDQTTPTENKQTNPTTSDIIPIQSEKPTTTTMTTATCDTPECVAATNELIKEQTELEKQRMLIAQQQQEQNEISLLENQRVTDNINAAQSQDQGTSDSNSGGGSSSGSGTSDNSQTSDNEQKNIFPGSDDKNLGAESHFVVMSQDKEIGLYRIVSDETDLDTGILPQTIRLVHTFDTAQDAIQWINDYDNRN